MGYQKKVIKGVSWMGFLRIITRLLTFVRLSILGRLLSPAEFGYFGIATLILAFLEILTETGINIFLVQEKSHLKNYVNSAWVVSITRGFVLAFIIFVTAPLVSFFFNASGAVSVIHLTALVPLIRGFINPAIITYQKDLVFHKEFRLRSVLFFIEVITSVLVGYITKSAESFTWGLIFSAGFEVILSYILIPLRPRFEIDFYKVRYVIKRGWWVTINGIFYYLAENGDTVAVGKLLGTASLGIYQVAYKFSTLPISEITNVVNLVLFPVFSKFSDEKSRLRSAFWKATLVTSFCSIALGLLLFLFARPMIGIFMGEQWKSAVPVIQILAIYGVLRTISGNFTPLYLSITKQNYVATITLVRLFVLVITIVPFIQHYGMVGAGLAMLASVVVEIPFGLYLAKKVLYS